MDMDASQCYNEINIIGNVPFKEMPQAEFFDGFLFVVSEIPANVSDIEMKSFCSAK